MGTILQDLRYAARMLVKSPATTTVGVIATLALGIGVTSAIFSVAESVLLRALPFPASDRLIAIVNEHSLSGGQVRASWSDLEQLRHQTEVLEATALYHYSAESWVSGVGDDGVSQRVSRIGVSDGFFATLGVQPLIGRLPSSAEYEAAAQAASAPLPVVISHGLWMSRFAQRPDVLGQELTLDRQPAVVAAVMPRAFRLMRRSSPEVYAPLRTVRDPGLHDYSWRFWDVVARLKPGVALAQAQAALRIFSLRQEQRDPAGSRGIVARAVPLHESLFGSYRAPFPVLFGAASLLLLITCASVANLLLARAGAREREVAVRSALGASRWRIVRQLLLESALLALAGGSLGLLVGHACLALFNQFSAAMSMGLPRVAVNGPVIAFAAALILLTGVTFGLAPALQLARANSGAPTLKGGGVFSSHVTAGRLGRLLIASEVALALTLLVGTGLLLRSLARLTQASLGFEAKQVLTMLVSGAPLDGSAAAAQRQAGIWPDLLRRVEALPGVEAAGLSESFPVASPAQEALTEAVTVPGRDLPAPGYLSVETQEVTCGYFRAMGIRLLRGRALSCSLPLEPHAQLPEVVVNRSFAREVWPDQDPLGRTIGYGHSGRQYTVVGVVGDVKQHGARRAAPPRFVYTPLRYGDFSDYDARYLVLRTADSADGAAAQVRAQLHELGRDVSLLEARPMEQVVLSDAAWDRLKLVVVLAFGVLAMLLTVLGISGTVARTVAARRREVGVRIALGSPTRAVVALVLRQASEAAAIGLLSGLVVAWLAARGLASQFFGVSPSDPSVYAGAATLVIAATSLATYLPARRAARVDPMEALRCE